MIIPGEELNIKKTLESILKRQESMEENFKKYLIVKENDLNSVTV